MAYVLKSLYHNYNYFFNEYKDSRVENLPLLGSPFPVIILIVLYVRFVLNWGPKWMKDRKPFELTGIINIYNFLQIIGNLVLFLYGTYYSYWTGESRILCTPVNSYTTTTMLNTVLCTYIYFIFKIVDLLDTIFFVLRKKNSQITFLHVYHHGGMILATYVAAKFLPGSHVSMLGILNTFVHTIMYGYYFLTSFKPELKQSIWWKKHITQLQLVQFLLLILHFLNPILFVECAFPKTLAFIGFVQNFFMFVLFSDFYIRTYVKRKEKTV